MKTQILLFSATILIFRVLSAFGADINISNLQRIYPADTGYSFTLGEPFGDVDFIIQYSEESVSAVYFVSSAGRAELGKSDIAQIQYLKDLTFGISEDGEGKVRFGAYFEFAPNKPVSHPNGFPGCDAPCVSEEKSIAVVYLDENFEISIEF